MMFQTSVQQELQFKIKMAHEKLPHFGHYITSEYGDKVSIGYDSKSKKYEITEWNHDDPQKDIDTLISDSESYKATYDATKYRFPRSSEYPELREQLDLLYHDMEIDKGDKTGEWYKAIKKVKDDNPKPS